MLARKKYCWLIYGCYFTEMLLLKIMMFFSGL